MCFLLPHACPFTFFAQGPQMDGNLMGPACPRPRKERSLHHHQQVEQRRDEPAAVVARAWARVWIAMTFPPVTVTAVRVWDLVCSNWIDYNKQAP